MKKLHFYWRDTEYMVLLAQLPGIGIRHQDIPGGNSYKDCVIFGKDKNAETYMPKEIFDEISERGKIFLDPDIAYKHFEKSRKYVQRYDDFIEEVRALDINNLDNPGVIQLLKRLWEHQAEGVAFFSDSQSEPLIAAEKRLKEIILSKFSEQDLNKVIEILLNPPDFDKAQQQEFDWAELVSARDELTWDSFVEHGRKYPFIFRNNYHLENSFQYMKKRLIEDKKQRESLKEHLSKVRDDKQRIIAKQKKMLAELGDKELEYLVWLFHKSAIDRMNLKYTWAGVEDFLFYELFLEAAKRIGEDYEKMVDYYRPEDIVAALEGKGKLSDKELQNRKEAFFLGGSSDKIFFYSGQTAIDEAKKNYPELFEKTDLKELKGTSACLGRTSGEVLIVYQEGLDDLAKHSANFKEGQILVTGMTQPNMVPLMKKAGAIVTDEGGLTSHAAVISREFGKPCIVGTHKATQAFKTGDLVEVDADKGVVRLLKRV